MWSMGLLFWNKEKKCLWYLQTLFFSFVYCMHDHWFPQTLSARVMTLKYYILVPVHNPFFYLLKNRLFDTAGSPKKTFLAFLHYKIISFLAAWLITPRYLLLTVFGVDGVASIVDVNGPLSYTFLWPLESLWDAMTVWRGGSCPSSTTKMIFPRCTNATQHSDLVYIFSNSEEEFSLLTTSCFFILIENSLRKFPNLSRERFVKSFFISCTFSTVTFLTIFLI